MPRSVVPRRYEISLEPDLEAATFAGRESIRVEIVEPLSEILLNSHELEIHKAVLRNETSSIEGSVELLPEDQRARIKLDGQAAAGEWFLDLEFTGVLNDQLVGFYRSTFKDVDGVEQAVATTQFEATDARRAFPGWDEPDFKAVFSITLIVPEDLLAVSNSPEESREPAGEGKVAIQFADTMVMSTYLVAFVVGPFEATEALDVDGVPVRVITRGASWAFPSLHWTARSSPSAISAITTESLTRASRSTTSPYPTLHSGRWRTSDASHIGRRLCWSTPTPQASRNW